MPEEGNKVLIYNHGEKSMKHPFIIYADLTVYLKNGHLSKLPPKILYRKKISMKLLVIQCLHIVPLMLQKIS